MTGSAMSPKNSVEWQHAQEVKKRSKNGALWYPPGERTRGGRNADTETSIREILPGPWT